MKYRDKIERGEITPEQILEEENRRREKPIKLATVKRAINSLGYSVEELRRRGMIGSSVAPHAGNEGTEGSAALQEEAEAPEEKIQQTEEVSVSESKEAGEEGEAGEGEEAKKRRRKEEAPTWILRYRDKIERGEITPEQILEEENRRREKPIKLATVKRAINALGFSVGALRAEERRARGVPEAEVAEHPVQPAEREVAAAGYRIDAISEETRIKFMEVKRKWEESLGKSMSNDHFMNILLALASLVERGKTLVRRSL